MASREVSREVAPENFGAQPGGGSNEIVVMWTAGNIMLVFINLHLSCSLFPLSTRLCSHLELCLSLCDSIPLP